MKKGLYILVLTALLTFALAQDYSYDAVSPDDIPFEPSPVIEGVESAAVIGDQDEAALYVNVGKLAQGVVFPVHTHTDARLSTVLSGTMYYGVGETFDEVEFTAYPAGSVVYTPPEHAALDVGARRRDRGAGVRLWSDRIRLHRER